MPAEFVGRQEEINDLTAQRKELEPKISDLGGDAQKIMGMAQHAMAQ